MEDGFQHPQWPLWISDYALQSHQWPRRFSIFGQWRARNILPVFVFVYWMTCSFSLRPRKNMGAGPSVVVVVAPVPAICQGWKMCLSSHHCVHLGVRYITRKDWDGSQELWRPVLLVLLPVLSHLCDYLLCFTCALLTHAFKPCPCSPCLPDYLCLPLAFLVWLPLVHDWFGFCPFPACFVCCLNSPLVPVGLKK